MTHFWTSSGPSGSGKTHAATTLACERVPRSMKSAIILPTIALGKQSYLDAQTRFPDVNERIRAIVSKRGSQDKVAHRIASYLNDRDQTGDLLYLTHAGFLYTPHWHRADTWHLYVDEPIEITYHRKIKLRARHRDLLLNLINVQSSSHQRYGLLEPRDHCDLNDALG